MKYWKKRKESPGPNSLLVMMDFSENFVNVTQDEIQKAFSDQRPQPYSPRCCTLRIMDKSPLNRTASSLISKGTKGRRDTTSMQQVITVGYL